MECVTPECMCGMTKELGRHILMEPRELDFNIVQVTTRVKVPTKQLANIGQNLGHYSIENP